MSPSPRWRPRAAARRREAAARSEAAAAPPHPAARHRRAGRAGRRWAAQPPEHAWACCKGGARWGERARRRERGGRARLKRRRREGRGRRRRGPSRGAVGAHARSWGAVRPGGSETCPASYRRRSRYRRLPPPPPNRFPAGPACRGASSRWERRPAGRGEGAWGRATASSRLPPPAAFSPVGCAAAPGRPRCGVRCGGVRGTAEEQCLALVPQACTLGNGRRGESFSTEPVRLLLKPNHVKQENLMRIYRMSLVKDMFCICRFRGLGCKPLGSLSTNFYTCRAGKI